MASHHYKKLLSVLADMRGVRSLFLEFQQRLPHLQWIIRTRIQQVHFDSISSVPTSCEAICVVMI